VCSLTDTLRDALTAASEGTLKTIVSAWAQTEELVPGDGGIPQADLDQHLAFLKKLRNLAARAHGRGHHLYWYFRM
jgi:hypothetical protein